MLKINEKYKDYIINIFLTFNFQNLSAEILKKKKLKIFL